MGWNALFKFEIIIFIFKKLQLCKKSMNSNHFPQNKFELIHHDQPQISHYTSTGSLQNQIIQNQKTNNFNKMEQCINKEKTHRLNSCNDNKNKKINQEDSNRIIEFSLNLRKDPQHRFQQSQSFTENTQNPIPENGKKINSLIQRNDDNIQQMNHYGANDNKNLAYRNEEVYTSYNLNSFSQKSKKIFTPLQVLPTTQNLSQVLKKQGLSMFFKGSQILYPIPDHLLKVTSFQGSTENKYTVQFRELPRGFCYLVEMVNLSYLIPELFKIEEQTILKLNRILEHPFLSKDQLIKPIPIQTQLNQALEESFRRYMKQLSGLIIEQLSAQKLQSLATNPSTYNVLSLAKFSQQNQLLDFVFEHNWPLIIFELALVSLENNEDDCHKYQKSITFVKNCILSQQNQIPKYFSLKFEIISLLIDSYSRTTSFRELLNKKLQESRNVNKKKVYLEDQKRNIQQMIKKVQYTKPRKTKKINKKKNHKIIPAESDQDHQKQQLQCNHVQQVGKLQRQLGSVNAEIEKQNRQDSLSACHYMGKDRHGHIYWLITFFPNKLFVEKEDKWSYLIIQQIHQLLESLDRKGIEENHLYEKIQDYYFLPLNRLLQKMENEMKQNDTLLKPERLLNGEVKKLENGMNHFVEHADEEKRINEDQNDSSKSSLQNAELLTGLGVFRIDKDSLFRMIELGQKKMTQYLKQRNSRWGSEENKHQLFSALRSSHPDWLQQAKRQISTFNQRICVVEIQYKVFVQQSVQQVDSKVKKIQTKIWGINQKYKHNWYDFISSSSSFTQLFYAASVLYSLIKKYTSKHRKLRKQYEQVKQKSVWKMTTAPKHWKQSWNEQCEVCGVNGEVLCCDYCPKVYHLACVNLIEIPSTEYKCKSCKQQITTRNQFKNLSNSRKKMKK